MIVFLIFKILSRNPNIEPDHLWYGVGFALIIDAFLLSILIAWLRVTFQI